MDLNELVAASGFGWNNAVALVLTVGAYYLGVYIQHQYRRDSNQGSSMSSTRRPLMLRTQLLLGLIPCGVVVGSMGRIVECTLADWTLFFSLALICEQGFLVNKFFVPRLGMRSA